MRECTEPPGEVREDTEPAQHTPGPWSVKPSPDVPRDNIMYGKQRIAVIGRDSIIDGDPKANARLIAAAPDLLAACREALETAHWYQDNGLTGRDYDIRLFRAAIVKAENG